MSELLTIEELQERGQVTEHITPGNKTEDYLCHCGCFFASLVDYTNHRRKVKCHPPYKNGLHPQDLDKLPWKNFRKGNGEWIFSDRAPLLRDHIKAGNHIIGDYRYWLYGENKFIARRKMNR